MSHDHNPILLAIFPNLLLAVQRMQLRLMEHRHNTAALFQTQKMLQMKIAHTYGTCQTCLIYILHLTINIQPVAVRPVQQITINIISLQILEG